MKLHLSDLKNIISSTPYRIFGAARRSRNDSHPELQKRILRRHSTSAIATIVKRHLGVNTIKSLNLLTHGTDSLVAEVDDTWIFKFPTDVNTATGLTKEERVLRFLDGRLFLQIPKLTILPTGYFFSCHRKIPGSPVSHKDYDKFDDATKDAFAEDLARFFAELHSIDPADAEYLNVGKMPPRMSNEKFAKMLRLLPSNYHRAVSELQTRIATENAKKTDEVFGHFDCAGGNMAFDYAAGRLRGVFDFADVTIGDVHNELQKVTKISYDCVLRVANRYRRLTGRSIDMDRIMLFGAECELWELLYYLNREGDAAWGRFGAWHEKFEREWAAARRAS